MANRKKPPPSEPGVKVIATHRRAAFDYELGERLEAGIVLLGSEVKALRLGSANLSDAWATVRQGEAFVEGLRIPLLKHVIFGHHREDRPRKLLLHRRQIAALRAAIERKGMTAIVTRLYFRDGRVKLELALARGRAQHDKRQTIKNREAEREARTAMDRARKGG